MQNNALTADIVILGHIAQDIIEIDGKSRIATGGAVYYGGIAGSHMGLKITVITRLKKENFSLLNEFEKHGVKYFAYPSEETSGLKNIYNSENMETRICKPLGFAGLFKKEEIPEIKTRFFIISPITAGEIDISLLEYLYKQYSGKICLDIQGFVRVRNKEKDEVFFRNIKQGKKEKILSKVNVLKADRAEAEALTNKKNIRISAEEILNYGPNEVLITHEKGVSVFLKNSDFFFPWKNRTIKGRTGRGDTSFISYIGSRITKNPKESLKFATALTSLKIERPGPFTLPLFQVEDLIRKEYW